MQSYFIRFTWNDGGSDTQEGVSSEDIQGILDIFATRHPGELVVLSITPESRTKNSQQLSVHEFFSAKSKREIHAN